MHLTKLLEYEDNCWTFNVNENNEFYKYTKGYIEP